MKNIFLALLAIVAVACADDTKLQSKNVSAPIVKSTSIEGPKVTFVELGSVNCIPCRAMKKVMDSQLFLRMN